MGENVKQCKTCAEVKPYDEFYALKSSSDGKHHNCKTCCKISRARENVRKRDKKNKLSRRQDYRAKINQIESDKGITLDGVYKRDNGICQLCGKWVMPKHASIDHIIPLIKDGTHTWDNVQLSHIRCNLVKGDR